MANCTNVYVNAVPPWSIEPDLTQVDCELKRRDTSMA